MMLQTTTNQPQWNGQIDRPFQEVWYLKLVSGTQGFWLRFTLLVNPKKKKFIAETWAILFTRTAGGVVNKIACKETHPLENFSAQKGPLQIRIGTSFMEENRTVGNILQHRLHWDLRLENPRHLSFNFVPPSLRKSFLVKNYVTTSDEDLRCSGVVELGSQRLDWNQTPGMRGHLAGPQNGHSWVWGHCNSFVDEQGNPSDLVVDALSARARLGKRLTSLIQASPVLTTCFFYYRKQNYTLCSLWGALTTASHHSDTGWQFLVPFGEMSFHVQVSAQLQDFAGLTYEDTDGALLYCANAKLADMSVEVRHQGHLQGLYRAKASAAFEVVTRTQNPLIPLLL